MFRPRSPRPPVIPPIFLLASSCELVMASLTAASTMSCSISTSSGSTTSGSISIETSSRLPVMVALTAPPPALAVTVSLASSSWACCICCCICWTCCIILFTFCRFGTRFSRSLGHEPRDYKTFVQEESKRTMSLRTAGYRRWRALSRSITPASMAGSPSADSTVPTYRSARSPRPRHTGLFPSAPNPTRRCPSLPRTSASDFFPRCSAYPPRPQLLEVDGDLAILNLHAVGLEPEVRSPWHARVTPRLQVELEAVPGTQEHVAVLRLPVRARCVRYPHPLDGTQREPGSLVRACVGHDAKSLVVEAGPRDPAVPRPVPPHGSRR